MRRIVINKIKFFVLFIFLIVIQSCKKSSDLPPIDDNVDLDGKLIQDSSLINPANFLLSASKPNPSASDLLKPVVILVHGFTACTFEWTEFRDWSKSKNDFMVSVVLMGGHGRDYQTFRSATWKDWQQPVIDEYNKLKSLGYKKINLAGSSTGCPIILDMVSHNKIDASILQHIFFIDPIIVPSNKSLSLIHVVGPMLGYVKSDMDPGENGFWYKYRPYQALEQLNDLTKKERKEVENGIKLPTGVTLKIFKAKSDGSADPISAVLLHKGVKNGDGTKAEVIMIDTKLHVYARLHGRASYSNTDKDQQLKTFEDIHSNL